MHVNELTKECLREWTDVCAEDAQQIQPKSFYQNADAVGPTYGPLFQGIHSIKVDSCVLTQVAGIIRGTNTRASGPKELEFDRLSHPTTLDNFLQLELTALGGLGFRTLRSAMVPTFVEEISISANIAAHAGELLNVVVNLQRHGSREAKANIFALDPTTLKPVVLMDGFHFVAINGADESETVQPKAKYCFKPAWEPEVELIDPQNLDRELQAAL